MFNPKFLKFRQTKVKVSSASGSKISNRVMTVSPAKESTYKSEEASASVAAESEQSSLIRKNQVQSLSNDSNKTLPKRGIRRKKKDSDVDVECKVPRKRNYQGQKQNNGKGTSKRLTQNKCQQIQKKNSSEECTSSDKCARKRQAPHQKESSGRTAYKRSNHRKAAPEVNSSEQDICDDQEGKDDTKYTPFELQVSKLKAENPGMILMIQSGYKYYFYGEDAEIASKVLNIAVFPNHNSLRSCVPVERCAVHARKLTEAGYKVGIVKQQEVAELRSTSGNVFDRKLTAVYTKATAIGEEINPLGQSSGAIGKDGSEAKFILSLAEYTETASKVEIGFVAFDAGTGEAFYDKFEDGGDRVELYKWLEHLSPAEILASEKISASTEEILKHCKSRFERQPYELYDFTPAFVAVETFLSSSHNEQVPEIKKFSPSVICALSVLLEYLRKFDLQCSLKPENLQSFSSSELYVHLDGPTVCSLEIFKSIEGSHYGSLLWLFDRHSHTHFGSRVLREWLSQPLRDIDTLKQRQDAVAELLHCSSKTVVELYSLLQKMPDLDRGLTTVLLNRSNPASIFVILENLKCLKERLEAIVGATDVCIVSPLLNTLIKESVELLKHVPLFLGNMDQNAASKGDVTSFLRDYSDFPCVVELQEKVKRIKDDLGKMLPSIAQRLGLFSIKYVSVYGEEYLVEVKLKQIVPSNWMKISETKQLSRYRPPEVAQLYSELCVLKALLKKECQVAWQSFVEKFNEYYSDHKKAVKNLAHLDALIAMSQLARSNGYCRPELINSENVVINIDRGKHPIVSVVSNGDFISNDTSLQGPDNCCMILSGPNMGGKSCYVRQVALIVIMAHIGSYVPAESATISTIDAVYTRVGARDDIMQRRSTLMLELEEAAMILKKATQRSLVLMDELGRGTSSHDGAAIAVTTLSHLLNKICCPTLFITHYPSVMDVAPNFNFHMGFMISSLGEEYPEMLTFLYTVCAGRASHSYGLNVCRLAGVPAQLIHSAQQRAEQLKEATERRKENRDLFLSLWKAPSFPDVGKVFQNM